MKKTMTFLCVLLLLCSILCSCTTAGPITDADSNPTNSTGNVPEMRIELLDPESSVMPQDNYECIVDTSKYSSSLLLTPEVPVTDFRVVMLEYVESGSDPSCFRILWDVFSAECLSADKPLIIHLVLPETIPNVGIVYVNQNNETKLYTICESGLDGTPLLVEGTIASESTSGFVQMGSPIMEVSSTDEMTAYLKFSVPMLDKAVETYIVLLEGSSPSIGEIRYSDGSEFRMKRGSGDISGIYGGTCTENKDISGIDVSFYAYENITYAIWEQSGFALSYIYTGDGTAEIEILIRQLQ